MSVEAKLRMFEDVVVLELLYRYEALTKCKFEKQSRCIRNEVLENNYWYTMA